MTKKNAKLMRSQLPGSLKTKNRSSQKSQKAQSKKNLDQIIRVDHAGEYGAVRIYQGQLAVLKNSKHRKDIEHMLDQEREHLAAFEELIPKHKVRPTALHPLWHVGAYAMGAGSALLGEKAAMACTVAVESVIDGHYAEQEEYLKSTGENKDLLKKIQKFRAEEMEHHDAALEREAEKAPFYPVLHAAISGITKAAIEISKKI